MAELNKSNKQKIDVNTYRFASGRTIDEILKSDSRFWATDEQCLLNMIDSNWRYVEDFITEKEKELAKKFQAAANNPETDLKLLAVQSDVATEFLCQKHTNQDLLEKARNDPNGRTRPYSKDVVNVENQINFPYELPSWIKNSIEEIPSNWFEKTPQQLQEEQEKEEIITAQAAVAAGLSYEEWEEMLNDNEIAEERIEQINGGVSEATLNKTDLEHIKRDFSYIRDIFETGDSISVKNEMVGLISIDKGNIGKSGNGLQHICTQRFEKDGRSVDEITAMLALVVNSAENGTVSRNNEIYQNEKDIGTYDIEKNGIIAFVSKTRDGNDEKFVITGFDDNSKKIEASDAINAVIAENSYAPDFVIVKEQVVATLASSYMLHLNEIESNLLNPKKDNIKRINKELKLLENYKNSDEIKRYFKNNSEDFDKVKKSIKKINDLTNTSSEYQDIKKRINDLAVININEEVEINKTATNTELEDAKKIIQEKDKELDIWTAKAQADKETINNLTEQLEQKDKIIQKQDEALRKELSIHNSSCDITVPQRDSNGNEIIGKDGKALTSTLHCTEGIDAALGKLSRKCVDLTLENKQLREQLNQEKNRNANSQSDNSSWSD